MRALPRPRPTRKGLAAGYGSTGSCRHRNRELAREDGTDTLLRLAPELQMKQRGAPESS